ncbi:unnamed protein product [Paramecium octaurelia]|uniref:ODAD1 central coiled coil region domain-containing protein n=1 Tax=Paramecium octaurelia TaxID=43137 RepID=A0A8S1UWX4_PAROT|nr:unnamed protein product [Paramecium octaurelia]
MNQTQKSFDVSKGGEKLSDIESLKRRTYKKILMMSSMNKNIMKYIQKAFQLGPKYLTIECLIEDVKTTPLTELERYGATILDKDRLKELQELLGKIKQMIDQDVKQLSSDQLVQLIKYFVLSPVEKTYIQKIEAELAETKNLDEQIKAAQSRQKEQQDQKIEEYRQEKNGQQIIKQNLQSQQHQISVHENKLEKANQKLNEIVAHNKQLREKINQLRKEKNMVEEISKNLEKELEDKKKNVEETIKSAGQAYYYRNKAEEELTKLQKKAEAQKKEFEQECESLNEKIQHDKKFKAFIQSKKKEQEYLDKLEKQIAENQEIIRQKSASNAQIDKEYMLSASKEQEIKDAFERIKQETGIHDKKKERESKQLLTVFIELYQNNQIMSQFVKELQETVEELERQIEEKKEEIQMYSTKGATNDNQRREQKMALSNKIQQEEKKKVILKAQYEKSIETINLIKKYLEEVFQAIDVDDETIKKLKSAAITEENMVHFLGILEQKGLDAIQEYARLIAEQLKLEKGEVHGLSSQVDDLNNIIAYENANIMNYYSQASQFRQECPDDVLSFNEEENDIKQRWFQEEEFKKQAMESISKRSGPKKPIKPKFKEREQKQ